MLDFDAGVLSTRSKKSLHMHGEHWSNDNLYILYDSIR